MTTVHSSLSSNNVSISNVTGETNNIENAVSTTTNVVSAPDPIAQTFLVSEQGGIFVTKLDLYFKTKSPTYPIIVQLRPVYNNVPGTTIIPFSTVRKLPEDVNVSEDASEATTFTFPSPVYLAEGQEYAICIIPAGYTDEYQLWVARLGGFDVSSGVRITKQPFTGVLFTSSNSRTWTPDQELDLKFNLYRAVFTRSQGEFVLTNRAQTANTDYTTLAPHIQQMMPSYSFLRFYGKPSTTAGVLQAGVRMENRENFDLSYVGRVLDNTSEGGTKSMQFVGVMSNLIDTVSPAIDLKRASVVLVKNKINNLVANTITGTANVVSGNSTVFGTDTLFESQLTEGEYVNFGSQRLKIDRIVSNTQITVSTIPTSSANGVVIESRMETNPTGPYASESRYISRRVVLKDGFDADDLSVSARVYMPAGTDVKAYYKIKHAADDELFEDKFWFEMEKATANASIVSSVSEQNFEEINFSIPTANKTGGYRILFGTGTVVNSNTVVTGSSSRFLEELRIGDTIKIGSQNRVIDNIANNTFLTVSTAFSAATDAEMSKVLNNTVVYTTENGSEFSGFKTFSVKLVFLSSNRAIVPRVKDLAAVALTA